MGEIQRSRLASEPARPDGAVAASIGVLVRTRPVAVAAAIAGVSARVVFWSLTDRRFEDGLITVAHARNAADGLGLTHHAGEPLTHGFTSALSVLVPLLGVVVAFDDGGFLALRIASLVAFVVSIAATAGIGRALGISQWLMLFPFAYLALDQNQIFFGMSGMETQIATAVLLAGIYVLMTGRVVWTGVLLGLALLARPDFVLWVVPALAYLAFRRARDAVVAAAVASMLVLPWLVFTTLYYGSPVPNTIRAKALRYPAELPSLTDPLAWAPDFWDRVTTIASLRHMWAPLYEKGFVVRVPVDALLLAVVVLAFVALAAAGVWFGRANRAWLAAASYGGLFLLYKIYFLPPSYYEWYVVPFMALAAISAAGGLASLSRFAPRAAIATAAALALVFSLHIPATLVIERRIQHKIEDRVRVPMAQYLNRVVRPGERVVSESAGYIGYYGGVTLYDYPGLTSPGALGALEELPPERRRPLLVGMSELASAVRPEWIVARPEEWDAVRTIFPETAARYVLDREFSVSPSESELRLGGVEYASYDRVFLVLNRTKQSSGARELGGSP